MAMEIDNMISCYSILLGRILFTLWFVLVIGVFFDRVDMCSSLVGMLFLLMASIGARKQNRCLLLSVSSGCDRSIFLFNILNILNIVLLLLSFCPFSCSMPTMDSFPLCLDSWVLSLWLLIPRISPFPSLIYLPNMFLFHFWYLLWCPLFCCSSWRYFVCMEVITFCCCCCCCLLYS